MPEVDNYCSLHGLYHFSACCPVCGSYPFATYEKVEEPVLNAPQEFVKRLEAANAAADLDPNDPFDKVILKMIEVNRAKRRDYALDGEFDSNFVDVAYNLGIDDFGNVESAYALLLTKVARIRSLRKNGRMADPSNESVVDTFVDLANYAVLCLAMIQEKNK